MGKKPESSAAQLRVRDLGGRLHGARVPTQRQHATFTLSSVSMKSGIAFNRIPARPDPRDSQLGFFARRCTATGRMAGVDPPRSTDEDTSIQHADHASRNAYALRWRTSAALAIERQAKRRSRRMASQAGSRVHRGEAWIEDGDWRSGRLGIAEQKSLFASIQTEPRIPSHDLCGSTSTRAGHAHDDIDAGGVGGHCFCMRVRRPVAFVPIFSTRRRYEPRTLASDVDR
jgi:hypothetical protein